LFLDGGGLPNSKRVIPPLFKIKSMTQIVTPQNIDDLILGIEFIIKNRYSLLDEDRRLLQEVVVTLKKYKQKRRFKGTANLLLLVKAVELLTKFFV
jgi:hypothetical protein